MIVALTRAMRRLRRSPFFLVGTVGSLALAIGAASSVGAVAWAVFFTPPPFEDPDRLVELFQSQAPGSRVTQDYLQPARIHDWVDHDFRTLERVAGAGMGPVLIERRDDGAVRVPSAPVVGDWFAITGVPAARGRVLGPSDLAPGAPRAAVLSDALWRARGAPALGSTLRVSDVTFTIVGVMPAHFQHERRLWVAAEALPSELQPTAFTALTRLRPAATHDEALAEVVRRAELDAASDSSRYGSVGVTARAYGAASRGREAPALWLVTGVVLAVLLLALSNLTQIFLARAQAGGRDFAIRASLGGTRMQIAGGLAMDAVLVSATAAALGWALSTWGTPLVEAYLSQSLSIPPTPRWSWPALVLSAGLGTLAGVVAGVEPLRRVGSLELHALLQRRSGGVVATGGERRLRDLMVGAQVAVSLVLLAVTGVFTSASRELGDLGMGFAADELVLLVADFDAVGWTYDQQWSFARALAGRLRPDPTVAGVSLGQEIGIDYPPRPEHFVVSDGTDAELDRNDVLYRYNRVDAGALEALGLELVAGRDFTSDDGPGSAPVAIVSQRAADVYWPDRSPLGGQLKLGVDAPWITVVGVVEDAHPVRELGVATAIRGRPMPTLYLPAAQTETPPAGWRPFDCCDWVALTARARDDPADVIPLVRREAAALAPDLPLLDVSTIRDRNARGFFIRPTVVAGRLVSFVAVVAMALALLGIVGIVGEGVTRRRREIGVRIALGARARHVLRLTARESSVTSLAGAAAGVAALVWIDRGAAAVLFDYNVRRVTDGLLDPAVLGAAASLIVGAALATGLGAAVRALRVDPAAVLRSE